MVNEALDSLDPRIGQVMRMRLAGESNPTIGAALGVSRQRVDHFVRIGTDGLRAFFEERGLALDDLL